jgi:hypothetical protein
MYVHRHYACASINSEHKLKDKSKLQEQ